MITLKNNLLTSDKEEPKQALAFFQKIVDTQPDKDAHAFYDLNPLQPWDSQPNKMPKR